MDEKAWEEEWEERQRKLEEEITPMLTDQFMATLRTAAGICMIDEVEMQHFVDWCDELRGKPKQEVEYPNPPWPT